MSYNLESVPVKNWVVGRLFVYLNVFHVSTTVSADAQAAQETAVLFERIVCIFEKIILVYPPEIHDV